MRFELENKLNDFLVNIENDIESRKKQKKLLQPLGEKQSRAESWKNLEKEQKAVQPPAPTFESLRDTSKSDSKPADEDDDDLAGFIDENPWSGSKKPRVDDAVEEKVPQELDDPLISFKREEEKRDNQDKSVNSTSDGGRKFPQVKIQQKKLAPKPKL